MTDKKVSVEEMLDALNRVYSRWGRMSETEMQEYEAIRTALLKMEEWKKEAKSIHDIWPKDLRRKGKSHEELSDEERAREHDLAEDIRDFGEEGKK